MKRIITITLALLLALCTIGCAAPAATAPAAAATAEIIEATEAPAADATAEPAADAAAEPAKEFRIGVIQYVEHEALDSAREGFVKALNENDKGVTFDIDVQNAQADQSNLATISDRFVSNNVDLVLAIATPAAQSIAGKTTEIPILATAVTDFAVAKLVKSNEAPNCNVSGTTDMNPIKEQIELLTKLAPEAKTVGCIYNGGEDNSVLQAQIAKAEIEALGLAYTEVTVTSTNDVQQAVQTLAGQCDAIYIPTDNTLASSMPVVSGVTMETKTPVICGESGMVTAGGLATLGINYFNLGYQTGLMALRILVDGEDIAAMPVESLTEFDYVINAEVAEAIGVTIPEDLLQYVK